MTNYNFILRDDALEFELPITIYTEEPLEFELTEGEEPSQERLEILIDAACSGDIEIPEVTDAYYELCEFFYHYMTNELGEWDDDVARRLGRLIGIACYFDAGVNLWVEHFGAIADHAQATLGYRSIDSGEAFIALLEQFQDKSIKILKRIDANVAGADKTVLSFGDLSTSLQINEHDLRRFLKQMFESGHYPNTWKRGRVYKIPRDQRDRIQSELMAWLVDN